MVCFFFLLIYLIGGLRKQTMKFFIYIPISYNFHERYINEKYRKILNNDNLTKQIFELYTIVGEKSIITFHKQLFFL